jgi:hypothetical protein
MKVKFTVEAEISKREVYDTKTLKADLLGEWVKVKSGLYENAISGTITSIELSDKLEKIQILNEDMQEV